MRIIRAAECRRMPWKNGGGETTEIAVFPEGAGLDDFVWRLSAARVAQDGPFSIFPDVDRTLAILGGGGLRLSGRDGDVTLDDMAAPYSFAADQDIDGSLLAGPVDDLNIMTRRGRAEHRMRREVVGPRMPLTAVGTPTLVYCAAGDLLIDGAHGLGLRDCAALDDGPFTLEGSGIALIVDIVLKDTGR